MRVAAGIFRICRAAVAVSASRLLHALLTAAILFALTSRPLRSEEVSDSALIDKIAQHVDLYGWKADMGRMCRAFELFPSANCTFKQIAVSDAPTGILDNHGFNIRIGNANGPTELVIYHLTPWRGDFFVVSPTGELRASFKRAKGIDYTPVPLAEGRQAFARALAYWRANLEKVKALDASGDRPRTN